jgi:hypothetical protein
MILNTLQASHHNIQYVFFGGYLGVLPPQIITTYFHSCPHEKS